MTGPILHPLRLIKGIVSVTGMVICTSFLSIAASQGLKEYGLPVSGFLVLLATLGAWIFPVIYWWRGR